MEQNQTLSNIAVGILRYLQKFNFNFSKSHIYMLLLIHKVQKDVTWLTTIFFSLTSFGKKHILIQEHCTMDIQDLNRIHERYYVYNVYLFNAYTCIVEFRCQRNWFAQSKNVQYTVSFYQTQSMHYLCKMFCLVCKILIHLNFT